MSSHFIISHVMCALKNHKLYADILSILSKKMFFRYKQILKLYSYVKFIIHHDNFSENCSPAACRLLKS